MVNKRDRDRPGKHRDPEIKIAEGRDKEGQINRKQSGFNERTTNDRRKGEDDNELNKPDNLDEIHKANPV
jgi:hypothetical protein